MSEEKKKNDELKLKKPTVLETEVGYVNEQPVENSSTPEMYSIANVAKKLCYSAGFNSENERTEIKIEDISFSLSYKDAQKYLTMFDLSNLREQMSEGKSISSICSDMKNFIMNNYETNPELVHYAICKLLGDAEDHYDEGTDNFFHISGFTRSSQGNTTEEIMTKILNTNEGEQLHGFVCSTISEFGMKLLDECGIKATMLSGGTKTSNHTALLWQRADGKYVQSNYGKSYVLDAPTIKDAAREVYKKNLGLLNNGYIYFVDSKGSYQEFAMKDEAVWGNELDKRDYNDKSLFNRKIANNTTIGGKVNFSNQGSVSAEVNGVLAYGNESGTIAKETSFSLGYKKSNLTSLADSSESIGAKVEHKVEKAIDNGVKFSNFKAIVDLTTLRTNNYNRGINYLQPIASREFTNPEQVEKLREFYGHIYEEHHNIENYKNNLENLNNTLEHYQFYSENQPDNQSPISKEDWIKDYISNYSYFGIKGNELTDPQAIEYVNMCAEESWGDYLINNFYAGADEILRNRISDTNDRIINYDKYKEEYINNELENIKSTAYWDEHEPENPQEGFSTTNLTAFVKHDFGKEKTLLKDGGVELVNGYQLSGLLGFNYVTSSSFSFGGDARITAEDGLKLDIKNKTTLFSNSVSAGITADFAIKTGELKPTVSPGIKLNGSSVFQHKIGTDVTFGAGVSGYAVVTRPSSDYGATGYVQAAYKTGKNTTIFGSLQTGLEKQQLRIGGFNQLTENVSTLGATIGANINNRTNISLNYYHSNDRLNSTRNKDVISLSANISL